METIRNDVQEYLLRGSRRVDICAAECLFENGVKLVKAVSTLHPIIKFLIIIIIKKMFIHRAV